MVPHSRKYSAEAVGAVIIVSSYRDAFNKREQADENYYVKQREREK